MKKSELVTGARLESRCKIAAEMIHESSCVCARKEQQNLNTVVPANCGGVVRRLGSNNVTVTSTTAKELCGCVVSYINAVAKYDEPVECAYFFSGSGKAITAEPPCEKVRCFNEYTRV